MSFFLKLLFNSGIVRTYFDLNDFLLPVLLAAEGGIDFLFDLVVVVGVCVHNFQLESIVEETIKLGSNFDSLGAFGEENAFLREDGNSKS